MDTVESAILRTVLYADVFHYPLTAREIHHFLLAEAPVTLAQVEAALAGSVALGQALVERDGYYACAGHEALIEARAAREQESRRLMPLALDYGRWLARLPFVRMVALTGALAMDNAVADDDIDYLLVTTPGRVWLARAFSIALVRVARMYGVKLCPNFVLAEDALEQQRKDVFIAHEIAQMVPLYGRALYAAMRGANAWTLTHLPNAAGTFRDLSLPAMGGGWRMVKRGLEWMMGGWLGDRLERWEYQRKLKRFAPQLRQAHSAARLDEQQVKGHFQDHGHSIMNAYQQRLEQHGLVPVAGD